jgi:copper chaperone
MMAFEVNDMTCGHCVGAITQALKATDEDAKVRIDLATHRVEVESASASAAALAQAIEDAGYTPVPVPVPVPVEATDRAVTAPERGCRCGQCQ